LFRQLSVFAGGWSFEAIQAICSDMDVLSLLTQLVNKSLVMVDEQAEGTRYRLPETVRQYARDKLLQAGEAEAARDRHLDFFVRFAEQAEPKLRSAEQMAWLDRVEIEHDNLRTALAWSLESGKRDRALELAGALYYFWELRGYWSEGQRWLDEALALDVREPGGGVGAGKARRAKALYAKARLHYLAVEFEGVRTLCEESLRLWRELDDKWWMAVTLELLGVLSLFEGDLQAGRVRFDEGVALARQVEDRWPLALCLVRLSNIFNRIDLAAAHRISDEAVAVARGVGDKYLLGFALINLAGVMFSEGNLVEAESVAEEALREAGATGANLTVLFAFLILVTIACLQGAREKARGYSVQVMALARETGVPMVALFAVFAFGAVASISGQPARAVRLFSVTQVWAQRQGIKLNLMGGPMLALFNRFLETARAQLDPAAFEAAWAAGQEMTLEQAIQLAEDESHSI
jgi:non-specific serine/threonine protein kinase